MNRIAVFSLNAGSRRYEKKIKKTARWYLRLLKQKNCRLEIFLAGGREMRFLNAKFRNKNKPTEILTFVEPKTFPHPESKLKFLGEIYLNPGLIAGEKLNFFLAHGLLHLLGFNHRQKNDRMKMEAKERFLISNV